MGPPKPGSSQRRTAPPPDPAPSLPHDRDREERQPYAKEVDDYKHGVVTPPDEQAGREANPEAPTERTDKSRRA